MISDPFGSWDGDPPKDKWIEVTHYEPSPSAFGDHRKRRNRKDFTNTQEYCSLLEQRLSAGKEQLNNFLSHDLLSQKCPSLTVPREKLFQANNLDFLAMFGECWKNGVGKNGQNTFRTFILHRKNGSIWWLLLQEKAFFLRILQKFCFSLDTMDDYIL